MNRYPYIFIFSESNIIFKYINFFFDKSKQYNLKLILAVVVFINFNK